MRNSVVIIGDTGTLGKSLKRKFISDNKYVIGISRNEIQQEKSDSYHHEVFDVTKRPDYVVQLIEKYRPMAVIMCAGNHLNFEDQKSIYHNISSNVSFTAILVNSLVNQPFTFNTHLVFCSSIMAEIPDRKYPSYGAAKAGLNHYIRSILTIPGFPIRVTAIVLGPLAEKRNNQVWQTSVYKVSDKIVSIIKRNKSGVLYYPSYLHVLHCAVAFFPNLSEKFFFRFRNN